MSTKLPEWFAAFLSSNGMSETEYLAAIAVSPQPDAATHAPAGDADTAAQDDNDEDCSGGGPLPRYIRMKPASTDADLQARLETVASELGTAPVPVPWLPGFFSLPSTVRIASLPSFKAGWFYGIDAASGVAVDALDVQPGEQILDICCAPGGKLCYIADRLGPTGDGTVTGVDISAPRLHNTRSFVQKYRFDRIRLFQADGTTFNVPPLSRIGPRILISPDRKPDCEQPLPTSAFVKPFYATQLLRVDPQIRGPPGDARFLYDKVIVDAECTTDGSASHILNSMANSMPWKGWEGLRNGWMSTPEKLDELEALQRGLIMNGYRLVKPGGVLVYSTCSLTRRQNEDVIAWFMVQPQAAAAQLVPLDNTDLLPRAPSQASAYPRVKGIEHVVRLSPAASQTSGMFIARIRKPLVVDESFIDAHLSS